MPSAVKNWRLKESGINPFPYSFERTHTLQQLAQDFEYQPDRAEKPSRTEVSSIAGRLMTMRDMGKSCFANLGDGPHRSQIYVKKDVVGEEAYKLFQKDTDMGDIIGVEGTMFRTKTNELTLRVTEFTLLAKALLPLPEKWHGLKDVETRYRQRELDLISNPAIQTLFIKRSQLIRS